MLDTKALAEATALIVRQHVEAETRPLLDRIAALEETIKGLPEPKDGVPGRDGTDGVDGKSVTLDDVLPTLQEQVKSFLDALPAPKDGAPGRDGADGKDGAPGEPGKPGRDGLDIKELFRAEGGRLLAVMSDGSTKDLGVFVGRDGKDGETGKPGRDGFDLKGFDTELLDDGRTLRLSFKSDEWSETHDISFPVVLDRGIFKEGETYVRGDGVTWGGSFWIAQEETGEKPDTGKGWRLAVKRGRDGKSA